MPHSATTGSAWVVDASMGLGHQRAAYPLRGLAPGGQPIHANRYPGIPALDRERWESGRSFYEAVSRLSDLPLIGRLLFAIFDRFQRIAAYYPRTRAEQPTLQLRELNYLIARGWGRHLVEHLARTEPLPFLATFFTPAFMAEAFNYPGPIYCVVTDTDISRAWAPLDAGKSRIVYFASTSHAADRLARYGVRPSNIVTTGFPLPQENLGSRNAAIVRHDTAARLRNLDPDGTYASHYGEVVARHLGELPQRATHPLTLMFSVGGAGAQQNIAHDALRSVADEIRAGALRFVVACGTAPAAAASFRHAAQELGIRAGVATLADADPAAYFAAFNEALRTTDILWTKPSELSFYAGLGIPIVIAPPLGAHEKLNRDWLVAIGAGRDQADPRAARDWIHEWLRDGWFAEAAMQGFVEIEKGGAYAIEDIVRGKKEIPSP